MTSAIRPLDPVTDRAALSDFYKRAADYIRLEQGSDPDETTLDDFFTDAPPGLNAAAVRHFGLFEGKRLQAIASLAFGWPEPKDAYLGLLLIDAELRGRGLGRVMLAHIMETARMRNARRLLLAVLDQNPRARAFWEREGFRVVLTLPEAPLGQARHIRHRMERLL